MPISTGSFYYERTASGNLIGEFANDLSSEVMTETANPTAIYTDFIGKYESVWYDFKLHKMDLTISYRYTHHNKIFLLEWYQAGTLIFKGEGFLHADTLIGYYKEL